MPTDPVCHKPVAANTPFKTTIGSRTYYFCSEDCIEEFVENTADYLELEEQSAPMSTEE